MYRLSCWERAKLQPLAAAEADGPLTLRSCVASFSFGSLFERDRMNAIFIGQQAAGEAGVKTQAAAGGSGRSGDSALLRGLPQGGQRLCPAVTACRCCFLPSPRPRLPLRLQIPEG